MAKTRIFNKSIDISQLLAAAKDLEDTNLIGPEVIKRLNTVRDDVYGLAMKRMLRGINLTQSYVERKIQTEDATEARPVAEIVAPVGARSVITNLSHYAIKQRSRPALSPVRRLRGNTALGIPRGQKQAGISAEVTKGNRTDMGSLFMIPSRYSDNDGNPLVFRRIKGTTGKGKIEAVKGPSVYQLFRLAASEVEGEAGDMLEQQMMKVVELALLKATA